MWACLLAGAIACLWRNPRVGVVFIASIALIRLAVIYEVNPVFLGAIVYAGSGVVFALIKEPFAAACCALASLIQVVFLMGLCPIWVKYLLGELMVVSALTDGFTNGKLGKLGASRHIGRRSYPHIVR